MGNDVAWDVDCEITMGNDVTRDVHRDVTISSDIVLCTYHGITMHNNVATNIFYCILYSMPNCVTLLLVVWNKNKNKLMFYQSGHEKTFVLCRAISLVLWTHEISLHKDNLCVLPRLIKHSVVLVNQGYHSGWGL